MYIPASPLRGWTPKLLRFSRSPPAAGALCGYTSDAGGRTPRGPGHALHHFEKIPPAGIDLFTSRSIAIHWARTDWTRSPRRPRPGRCNQQCGDQRPDPNSAGQPGRAWRGSWVTTLGAFKLAVLKVATTRTLSPVMSARLPIVIRVGLIRPDRRCGLLSLTASARNLVPESDNPDRNQDRTHPTRYGGSTWCRGASYDFPGESTGSRSRGNEQILLRTGFSALTPSEAGRGQDR